MKILNKILIAITVITGSTIVLNAGSSKLTMTTLSSSEINRSIGRTSGLINTFQNETNYFNEDTRSIADLVEIVMDISNDFEGEIKKNGNLKKAIDKFEYDNLYLINEKFEVESVLKGEENIDINEILDSVRYEFLGDDTKSEFSGIICSTDEQYIVSFHKIINNNKVRYIMSNLILSDHIGKIQNFSGSVYIHDFTGNDDFSSYKMVKVNNNVIYLKYKDNNIASFVKLKTYGEDRSIYVSLREKADVIKTIRNTSNMLLLAITIISIISSLIIYIVMKKLIINRILKVNNAVTNVTRTSDLNTRIEEDNCKDEISVLTRDLNSMFDVIQNYAEHMKHISECDMLTNLLNRRKIEEIGRGWIEGNEEFSIAFIDLDNFKLINDSLGHNIGDKVLCSVSKVLNKYRSEELAIGRLGGDEFVLMLKGADSTNRIVNIVEKILYDLKDRNNFREFAFDIKASVGINTYPYNSTNMVNMLQYADIAMYNVKRKGGNHYCIFDRSLLKSLEYETKIKTGLTNDEFEAYFQPIYDLESGRIKGAEALVRWNTSNGIIPPDEFLPIAKKSGDIVDIDKLVFKQACNLINRYKRIGVTDFQVSINASLKLLKQNSFLEEILNTISEHEISVKNIKIEITEDETIDDMEYMIDLLNKIRATGIEVALDDFGTGYSSFNYIKTLPLDVVKIDRSLLMDMEHDMKTESIIQTIIKMAHILNLTVTCEGVETKKQFDMLEKLECDTIQGYYLSRPLNRNDFEKFFNNHIGF